MTKRGARHVFLGGPNGEKEDGDRKSKVESDGKIHVIYHKHEPNLAESN